MLVKTLSHGSENAVEVLAGLRAGERVALEPIKAGMQTDAAPDGGTR